MIVEQTVTWLEMTSPDELRPGRLPPAPVQLEPLARVGGEPAGLIELEARPGGEVEITVFGLVPEFVGRGFGGHLLTRAVRLAWDAGRPEGTPTRRVWLHTASTDHGHALPNYLGRGFRVVRSEVRRKQVPAKDA